MIAFVTAFPVPCSPFPRSLAQQCVLPHLPQSARTHRTLLRSPTACTVHASAKSSQTPSAIKALLQDALDGIDFGLQIDPDAATMDEDEAEVETLIEQLEDMNQCEVPTRDRRLHGTWKMLYTSSTISRYAGGVTGLQRSLPSGSVTEVRQIIDIDDATLQMEEDIQFDIPIIEKQSNFVTSVVGSLRPVSEIRHVWEPKNIRFSFITWFADGCKATRAFKVADITYLDETHRVTRGQTGSVCLYEKQD